MSHPSALFLCILGLLVTTTTASAQLTVEGRAFGTSFELGGTPIGPLNTADTGDQSATAPGEFDRTGKGAVVPAAPLAEVVTSDSRTTGTADPTTGDDNQSMVTSIAGDVVVLVLPEAAPEGENVLEVATSGSDLTLSCQETVATDTGCITDTSGALGGSRVDALTIAGNPVGIPGELACNTVILAPELPLIILNEHRIAVDETTRSVEATINAVNIQAVTDAELLRLIVSSSQGAIRNVPANTFCAPIDGPRSPLINSLKLAELLEDNNDNGSIDAGDVVRFRIRAENSGSETLTNVRVVDRLPSEVEIDPDSVTVGGAAAEAVIGACPADANFTRCPDEPSQECLTVTIGELGPGESVDVTFDAEITGDAVDDEGQGATCNTALIGDVERNVIVDLGPGGGFDVPGISPLNPLATTGGGGCSVSGAAANDRAVWGLLLLLAGLAVRSGRRRNPH